jgi:diguanylate cyclase (GGDEF)-like protein
MPPHSASTTTPQPAGVTAATLAAVAPHASSAPAARGGVVARLGDWLLTRDRHQRVRLAQSGLANLLMIACAALMHVLARYGIADQRWIWPWTIVSVGGLLALFALIRSGQARRWSDPSLTLPQMLFAIFTTAAAYCITGSARAVVLPVLAVVMMFGMFGLTQRRVRIVGAWTLALFGAASLYWLKGPERDISEGEEIARFMMVAIIVLGVGLLTARLNAMRERMREQRIQLAAALERIRELATRDELTGCLNRRAMMERLEEEASRCARLGQPMCLVLLDLDHFKHINDAHGHATGDRVLRRFGALARASLRGTDLVARWGGEEFLLMLGGTSAAPGALCVQRLLDALAAERFDVAGLPPVTGSAGLAECHDGDCLVEALELADRALYRAKAAGRNRLEQARRTDDLNLP